MDILFAIIPIIVRPRISICVVLPIIVRPWISDLPFFPIIVHPWIWYLSFFQSSCVLGSPICRSSNHRASTDLMCRSSNHHASMDLHFAVGSSIHRASMDLLFDVLPMIVRPRISCVQFFQSPCVHGSPM